MTNEEIMAKQFPKEFEPSLEVAQDLIAKTPAFVRTSEPKFEKGRDTVESTPPFIIPVEAQTGPWALNVSESGEAAVASSEARAAELEQFYAEGTTPLAETKPEWIKHWKETDEVFASPTIKVDGDRTQLTEAQMSGVVGEVLTQTITESPSVIDQLIVNSKLSAVYYRIEALEEQNKKIIAALKHLGLDTNKHFR